MAIFCARITFFAVIGKKAPGFHGGVVRDDHHAAPGHAAQARDRPRGRRAAPFLVHFVGGVDAQLEKFGFRIDQLGDALARGEAAFLVLRFDRLWRRRPGGLLLLGF